jgi:hypothetical protein
MAQFKYRARRPLAQLLRANQSRRTSFHNSAPSAGEELSAESTLPTRKGVCAGCGHRRDYHCLGEPRQHWPQSEGAYGFYFCISEHCEARLWRNGQSVPCECLHFRRTPKAPTRLKRWAVHPHTACSNCQHPKSHHCVRGRQVLEVDGSFYRCPHAWKNEPPRGCTDSSCAEVVFDANGNGDFCGCKKFVNPYLRPRKRASKTSPPKLRKPRSGKSEPQQLLMNYREVTADGNP